MSVMERRLQLLLDQARYDKVADEAEKSGRSVAAVIREAIDRRFPDGDADRQRALRQLLDYPPDEGPAETWAEIKESLEGELERPGA